MTLPLLTLMTACSQKSFDYRAEAQAELAKTYSCPKDRVTATPRPDLSAYDLQVGAQVPPPDVAADPGRLAVWKQKQQALKSDYDRQKVMEARGCDKHIYYVCGVAEGSNQSQVIACTTARHPPSK